MKKRRAVVDLSVEKYAKYCSSFTFKLKQGIEGHPIPKEGFVDCYWSPKKYKLIYMHIDKCGSTSMTALMNDNSVEMGFVPLDQALINKDHNLVAKYFVDSKQTFFSLTRDPVSRWISGLNEFMRRYNPPIEWVIESIKNKKYIYDEHTSPQSLFLVMCTENGGDLKLIKMDKNISDKINKFFGDHLTSIDMMHKYVQFPHLRNSEHYYPLNYTEICKKLYETFIKPNPNDFNKLYEIDYELYENGI